MNIAYLVIAHNNPRHLKRLISALSSKVADFFVHIDKKSDVAVFSGIAGRNIHFVEERVSVFWADFSQIDATLILIKAATMHENNFDRFVLLSGVDYPVKSVNYIQIFFEKFPDTEFITSIAMPADALGKPISRLTRYRHCSTKSCIVRTCRLLLKYCGVKPRQRDYKEVFGALAPYAGSQWWALTRAACEHILVFAATKTVVVQFFRNTDCPDESFFQTILCNSRFRNKISRSLTYADWSDGGASPKAITQSHLAMFQKDPTFEADTAYGSGKILFARKFDDQAGDLVDNLDRKNTEKEK